MDAPRPTKPKSEHRLLVRGESVIASTGLALAAILMLSLAAAGGWSIYVHRKNALVETQGRVEMCGRMFVQSLESLLSDPKQDSESLKVIVNGARENGLSRCRVVLADGTYFVDAQAKVSVRRTVPQWPAGAPAPSVEQGTTTLAVASFPLQAGDRGQALLELAAGVKYPSWAGWEYQAGLGGIGAVGFVALLAVYRRLRKRVSAIGAIRESLLSMLNGETSADALQVDAKLGPEAQAWNKLLEERTKAKATVLGERAKESLGTRRDLKSDLAGACDALWQGLMVVDERQQIKYANGAAAVFLRVKRDELSGTPLIQHVSDPELLSAIKSVSAGEARSKTTVELRRSQASGGGNGVLRFSIRPVRRDDAGGAVVMIEDITQQRVADEARNAFVAQATHELRTPLTNIRLYVEEAIEAAEDDVKARAKCLNVINQESRRLERIVGDMLSVSEIEAGSFKLRTDDVRLDAVFEELRSDFEASSRDKGVSIAFDMPPKMPVLRGDRDKIVLAIHNLVGNAVKYTPKGGSVKVRVHERDDGVVVDVSDTGIGISPEEQELIFERFYRAKDKRIEGITGSGLGLALAREVARLHGGDIAVRSQLNQGSTFTFSLPIRAQAA